MPGYHRKIAKSVANQACVVSTFANNKRIDKLTFAEKSDKSSKEPKTGNLFSFHWLTTLDNDGFK